jgi:DNA-binding beta-propeller fold protein YncE
VASGQPIEFSFKGHTDRVTSIALSPDGSIIISSSLDNTVRVWDACTGGPIGSPLTRVNAAYTLIFSDDGNQFATCSLDGIVSLWDRASRSLLASYHTEHVGVLTRIAFSSDGRHLIAFSVDGSTHTWDATSGQPVQTSQSSDVPLPLSNKPVVLSAELGWSQDDDDEVVLRCYPVNNSHFGHWACIDGKIIRSDKNGSTSIIDMMQKEHDT